MKEANIKLVYILAFIFLIILLILSYPTSKQTPAYKQADLCKGDIRCLLLNAQSSKDPVFCDELEGQAKESCMNSLKSSAIQQSKIPYYNYIPPIVILISLFYITFIYYKKFIKKNTEVIYNKDIAELKNNNDWKSRWL